VRERFANQSRRDPETLRDERVKHRLQGRQQSQLSPLDEHTECPADSETARLCHLPSYSFVDEKEICPERLGEENGCGLSWIEPQV
jgi:hypothetical protein